MIASIASRPTSDEAADVRNHLEYDRAMPSMSEVKRRIMAQVIGSVLADEVDDRHLGSTGVVEIGEAIGETGAKMQKSACRFFRHPCIAVRSSGHDTFEEAEHATYFQRSVKRCDEMNFRGAGVGEARLNSSCHQRANQTFCAIHLFRRLRSFRLSTRSLEKTKDHSLDVAASILFLLSVILAMRIKTLTLTFAHFRWSLY